MNKSLATAVACAVALSACVAREPTDVELTTLLRREGTAATDKAPPIDLPAIHCLRAWSGDGELGKGLSAAMSTDEAKSRCRVTLDAWLASADRNPGKLDFGQIDKPAVVRRAMAMQIANAAESANRRPPPGLVNAPPKATMSSLIPGAGPDMGAQGESLKQAEMRCVKVQQLAAAGSSDTRLQRFSAYCVGSLRDMRAAMERSATHANSQLLDKIATDASNLSNTADKLISAAAAAPPPAK